MSTIWIVATGLSGVANARRENPHGHFTAGTSSSCVISNVFVFVGAAVVAGGIMAGMGGRANETHNPKSSTPLSRFEPRGRSPPERAASGQKKDAKRTGW